MLREIEARRSVRKFKDAPVPDETLMALLESARLAPSGHNTQPWHFIIVKNAQTRARLSEANHNQAWMLGAPVFIVCTADIGRRDPAKAGVLVDETSPEPALKQVIRDAAIAVTHILLEAEHMGLAVCWAGWFAQRDVKKIMRIPADQYVVGILCVGYGDEAPAPRPRRPLKDMVRYESWD